MTTEEKSRPEPQDTAAIPWWRAVAADFRFYRELCGPRAYHALTSYSLYAVLVYRFGRAANGIRLRPLRWMLLVPYHVLRIATELAFGISIARTADIGVPVMFHHHGTVFITAGCTIGKRCQIYHGVTVGESGGRRAGRPTIGDDVLIGAGAKILGSVRVGNGAKIGANAVVLADVPPGALAVGVPATIRGTQHVG